MSVPRSPPVEQSQQAEVHRLQGQVAAQAELLRRLQQLQDQSGNSRQVPGIAGIDVSNLISYSIRDALDAIPRFDGSNISFVYFVECCEEALSMINPTEEINLVRAVRNKLFGDAHKSILGRTFEKIQDFIEFLRQKYGPRETVYEALAKLAYICQKRDEKVVSYANRIREIGKQVRDAYKRTNNEICPIFEAELEKNLLNTFYRGLNQDIRITKEGTFENLEKQAIDAERDMETMKIVRQVMLSESIGTERQTIPTRRIEYTSQSVICQLCRKYGHTADKCYTLNQHSAGTFRNDPPRRAYNYNRSPRQYENNTGNNNGFYNKTNRHNDNYQTNHRAHFNPAQNSENGPGNYNQRTFVNNSKDKYCNFCRIPGHMINECWSAARRNNQNIGNAGNLNKPVRNEGSQGNVAIRPSHVITEQIFENDQ